MDTEVIQAIFRHRHILVLDVPLDGDSDGEFSLLNLTKLGSPTKLREVQGTCTHHSLCLSQLTPLKTSLVDGQKILVPV
jgi:hypothetical protein